MQSIWDLLQNFWTWNTPVSFLAGVGSYHLYCRARHTIYYETESES